MSSVYSWCSVVNLVFISGRIFVVHLHSIRTSANFQMGKLTLSSSDTVYLKDDNDAKSGGKFVS